MTETNELLREANGSGCVAESMVHKWHSTFQTNLNEVLLLEKKGGRLQMSITETNINTMRAVIDDNRHLSTRALGALLLIPPMIIRRILTEKLEMVCVAPT